MKKSLKCLCLLSLSSLVFINASFPLAETVKANESVTVAKSKEYTLSEEQKNRLDKYVFLDASNHFEIDENASFELSDFEYNLLKTKVSETNAAIDRIKLSSNEYKVVSQDSITVFQKVKDVNRSSFAFRSISGYQEGENAIRFYWWGARVWLSKTTVNYLGGGITLGGLWIPEAIVSKILATAGLVLGYCPGGIVFNYTPGVNIWGLEFQ